MSKSSVCIFGHRWSKFHLLETYHGLLTQVRVCKKCGLMEAPNTPLNICKKEAVKDLWNRYHDEVSVPPKKITPELLVSNP